MYLRSVNIKRLKRFADFTLDLSGQVSAQPRMWTVVIGENGTGKTSLLQAIALSAAGDAHVNALAKPVIGHLRDRRAKEPLGVSAEFVQSEPGTWECESDVLRSEVSQELDETTLLADDYYLEGESGERTPLNLIRAKNRPGYFVAAYGVGRFLPTPAETPDLQQPSIERLEGLFHSDRALTSLRFVDHLENKRSKHFSAELGRLLKIPLLPGIEGLELRGRGGVKAAGDLLERDRVQQRLGRAVHKLPAVALAHGHQSTLAWIADVLGHFMLEKGGSAGASELSGLVLIDEIDLYLHPRWQRQLIPTLKMAFPRLQFVVTTHSPAVLANVPPHEVVVLRQDEDTGDIGVASHDRATGEWELKNEADATVTNPDARVMTGTEIYNEYFRLDSLTPSLHGRDLRRLYTLATDPFRTESEDREAQALHDSLMREGVSDLPGLVTRKANGAPEDPDSIS